MRPIDWKCFLGGVSLTLALVLGVGAAQPNPAAPRVGRFWLGTGESGRAYVIDSGARRVRESPGREFHGTQLGGGEQ